MALVKLKVPCVITNRIGDDLYGAPVFGMGRNAKCAVLKLSKLRQSTTVRTDSSGTRGHADEEIDDAHLLLLAGEKININDSIHVGGFKILVSSIRVRYNIYEKIDHLEIEGKIE